MVEEVTIDSIFSINTATGKNNPAEKRTSASTVTGPPPRPKVVVKKKSDEIGTPSIQQALNGNFKGEQKEKVEIPERYAAETRLIDHEFTEEQLINVWPEFAGKYSDQVHLYNTLSVKPALKENNLVIITVENSVQQDQLRLLKPEIIGFLRSKLINSRIDVKIEMLQAIEEDKLLTDEQKLQAMMKKNPALQKMKNLFNLDFNG